MSKGKVVVLGVNGHIGRAVAEAFVEAGWHVVGMGRTDRHKLAGVSFVKGDADSIEDMRRVIGDTEVVVNALNLRYDTWDKGRLEAQITRVLAALGTTGKTMLFPGNIYNFAADDREVIPDLAQHPQTPRGAIRVRVEQLFEAAAALGDIQTVIVRAGDFYGPDSCSGWFDQAMFREIGKGKIGTMGLPGVGHSWAYLPDLARAFVALASLRSSFGAFERFHFAGHFVTPEQMGAAIAKMAPTPVTIRPVPLLLLQMMGLTSPIMREVAKMLYLWRNPMRLSDDRLDELLGKDFGTPFETAVAVTSAPFFDGSVAKAA
ncbi:MAG: NAD-dependent epimerase/dehydratase family protein [Devosia sp.]